MNKKKYIHIEKEIEDGKEYLNINIENINGADITYFLSEFIDFVSKKEDIPAKVFLNMVSKAIDKKYELENNDDKKGKEQ